MNKKINYGVIASVILVIVLLIGALASYGNSNDLKSTIDEQKESLADKDNSLLSKDTEISSLVEQVTTLNQQVIDAVDTAEGSTGLVDDAVSYIGKLFDKLFIGDDLTDVSVTMYEPDSINNTLCTASLLI